ncbi:uncharacterized protein LOC136086191 [Hydra vulgaris]|uniref:Uncharacterized protein LOC136086191 n=1 Tax=Hydra vulgaris TaxID=6087 RepID=A0ABM4CRP0_HYDVU
MADAVKKTLDKLGLNIKDARGQSYDNASNMSGKYKGLQALLKNENLNIKFIPCAGHSLNLVGVNAVDSCEASSDFFGWQIVCSGLVGGAGKDRKVTIKSLSGTRWSARAISTKVLNLNYNHILETLESIILDKDEKCQTQNEATALLKKIKTLDDKTADLDLGVRLLKSLLEYVTSVRENFLDIQESAKKFSSIIPNQYKHENKRKKTHNIGFDENSKNEAVLSGNEKFKIKLFAYESAERKLCFLTSFQIMTVSVIVAAAKSLCKIYPSDLNTQFPDGIIQFSKFMANEKNISALECLQAIRRNKLELVFPNVDISYRIFLTLPITNCSAERAFSKMAIVKNDLRSSMLNDRLNTFCLMTIERTLLKIINFQDVVVDFANVKARKVSI